ncbi:MAG: DUF2817 domain-containing protein [Planctomycetes bacterium]|nr:DUF2817 domain-containing protein [Planctomycetota bacterium]
MQHPTFSESYAQARERFLRGAADAGAAVESHPLALRGPEREVLAVDVARLGPADATRWVVVSSGLHGIEGYLGSALQLSLLRGLPGGALPEDTGLLLLHALNPYGFAWTRRFDQNNVDLNRNFLLPGQAFTGAPEGYELVSDLLNPERAPRRVSAFRLRAALKIAQHGFSTLKAAVAGGQYVHPRGLFFGGHRPAPTQTLLAAELPRLLAAAQRVVHLDLHTGLGARADYALLLDCDPDDPRVAQLTARFGSKVEGWDAAGTAYVVRGGLGPWCEALLPQTDYTFFTAEFGTVPPLQVIEALHLENRAHHWGAPHAASTQRAKALLRKAFAPRDPRWRADSLHRARGIVEQAFASLSADPSPALATA